MIINQPDVFRWLAVTGFPEWLAMLMIINQPEVFRWCEAIQEKRNMVLVAHNGEKVWFYSAVDHLY